MVVNLIVNFTILSGIERISPGSPHLLSRFAKDSKLRLLSWDPARLIIGAVLLVRIRWFSLNMKTILGKYLTARFQLSVWNISMY